MDGHRPYNPMPVRSMVKCVSGYRSAAAVQAGNFAAALTAFIEVLEQAKVRISMDGRGRWVDNVFIERLWRSVKYEDIYLQDYLDGKLWIEWIRRV